MPDHTLNIADENGQILASFTIPEGVPVGTKLVQFFGDQGSYGEATYTGKNTVTIEERRQVTTVTLSSQDVTTIVLNRYDPLAQTFTLQESRHIGGLDLWFENKGAKRVVVQIRDTNLGLPNQTILADGNVMPANINVNGSPTRIAWTPVFLERNHEYAIVILTDDADAAIMIGELGKYDAANNRWVTAQAYQIGVMLSSSNASTWTAHQNSDIAFRLLAAKFTETYIEVPLGSVEAAGVSDLIALANVERVSSGTDVEFVLTEATSGANHRLSEDFPTALQERVTDTLNAKAILRGTTTMSPALYPGVQIVLGNVAEEADYVTRTIPAGSNTKVAITYEAYLTGLADVRVYVANPGGSWTLVALTGSQNIGNSWVERTHSVDNFNGDNVRVKLVLSGNILYRPRVKSLRIITV
jgi:hypothetical protein